MRPGLDKQLEELKKEMTTMGMLCESAAARACHGLLSCDPYSLNVSAKAGRLAIRHIFSGRNLRISKTDLLAFCTGSTEGACRVCK